MAKLSKEVQPNGEGKPSLKGATMRALIKQLDEKIELRVLNDNGTTHEIYDLSSVQIKRVHSNGENLDITEAIMGDGKIKYWEGA